MANTLELGNGKWATGKDTVLAFNDQNNNFKPLPFSFSRASSATVVNKDGLIETVGSGEPRIDFKDNTKGALLLEPQRTNLIEYSEDFSNYYWAKSGAVVISDSAVSPNGTLNADKLNFTASNGEIVKGMTFISGQKYTMSFYAKTESGTLDFAYGNMDYSVISGTATNEWQRFVITQTLPTATRFPKIQTTEIGSLLLYGFQVEQGSYATSYIPTSGSAVTRVAEVCKGAGNEQVFNDSEGVIYVETQPFTDGDYTSLYISLSDNTTGSNFITIQHRNNGQLRVYAGNFTTIIYLQNIDMSQNLKIALQYKNVTDFKLYVNGTLYPIYSTPTNSAFVGLSTLDFKLRGSSSGSWAGQVRDTKYFDKALTDAQLQALTQ